MFCHVINCTFVFIKSFLLSPFADDSFFLLFRLGPFTAFASFGTSDRDPPFCFRGSTCFTSEACKPCTSTTSWKEWMNLVKTIWGVVYSSWCSTVKFCMERRAKCYLRVVGVLQGCGCLLRGLQTLHFDHVLKRVNEFGENYLRCGLFKLV